MSFVTAPAPPRSVRALFAGPGALRALPRARLGRVENVSRHGAYLRFGDDWLLVADPSVPFGPLSLVVDGFPRLGASAGSRVSRAGDDLLVGDAVISLARVRARSCTVGPARAPGPGFAAAAAAALALHPRPPAPLEPGLAALAAGRTHEGVLLLAGVGEGLTPAGDDVLAGHAAWLAAVGAAPLPTWAAAGRSSPLGLAYLRCAARGELPDPAARMLAALRAASVPSVRVAASRSATWGATSGAALVWGMAAPLARA